MTPLAHGGAWGALAEVGAVFLALALFGLFLWRAQKKEKERSNRSDDPGE